MTKILEKLIFFLTTILSSQWIIAHPMPLTNEEVFTLRILHTNDMHARFDETSALSARCSTKDAAAKKCYGGFARIATLVRQARNSTTPTLFLNAGDTYQGTVWFNVHKWKIVSKFLNLLKPDAISLGNHEFDDGPAGLVPFINKAEFPIVTANLDLSGEPDLAASNLKNSTILNVDGTMIGIIGYLTPETKIISAAGKVGFLDEVESIKREVKILQKKGAKILIAVGHSGFAVDKKIAAEVEGLDVVIGGHTNTFLYSGKRPDLEVPEGLYPTKIVQKSGRKVYVVQAYAYTKYLGNITLDFDGKGEVTKIMGNPILVDSSIEQAPDVLHELEKWRPAIEAVGLAEVGTTKVLLDGDSKSCRRRECNLGNLIADAVVDYNARQWGGGTGWTDAAISLLHSGIIRTSIQKSQGEKINMRDIIALLPFNNGVMKITMTGSKLLEVLEWGVRSLQPNDTADLNGAFLQFSGIQVIYDLSKPAGSRVHSAHVRCAACWVPRFRKLRNNATYTVLAPDFMRGGGDGYSMLTNQNYTAIGVTYDMVVADHIKATSPVHPGVEGRIRYLAKSDKGVIVSSEPGTTDYSREMGSESSYPATLIQRADFQRANVSYHGAPRICLLSRVSHIAITKVTPSG